MIVVKIELHPFHGGKPKEIGRMYIANDGTGSFERGNYDAHVCRRGQYAVPQQLTGRKESPKAVRSGRVEDYPRESKNVWRLIGRALKSCGFGG